MTNTAAKLNRAGRSHGGFLRVPYSVMSQKVMRDGQERKLSAAQRVTTAAIFSFSTGKKSADFTCRELSERYRISESSAFRAIRAALDGGLVKRKKRISEYDFEGEAGDDGFLLVREWLYFAVFDFFGSKEYLSHNEVLVLSYLMSQCRNRKGAAIWRASRRHISRRLNLSPTTVSKSIERLKDAGLIKASGTAKNKHTRETFSIVNTALERAKNDVVKRVKSKSQEVKEANERADRERYFAHLHTAAGERAEKMKARARADEAYRAADDDVRKLDIEIAKADVSGLPTLHVLLERQRAAQAQRAERLAAMNLTEDDLLPVWNCKKCSDSGFLTDGSPCACYPTRGRP